MLERERISPEIATESELLPEPGRNGGHFLEHNTHFHNPADRLVPQLVKRAFDICVASVTIVLLLPLMLGIAILVRCDDRGPVFFVHSRIGKDGRCFGCWKFRTMVTDADARLRCLLKTNSGIATEWKHAQKLARDPRVTRVGRFLRALSLDELPQLLNVIKGDMSLVGPRPVVEGELSRYGENARSYYRVRPGLTGLWQISGRNRLTYAERVRLDVWYAENWTLRRDMAILLRTIWTILRREGAC